MACWESMQRGIQNPTLSWISLQGNILLMTIGTSIISFSLAICVWPCTLFNSKDMPSSVCTGVVITPLFIPIFKIRVISYISIHVISSTIGFMKN